MIYQFDFVKFFCSFPFLHHFFFLKNKNKNFIIHYLCLQAQLVSKELIRVAILWHEMWHEAFEEASRLYFGEHNIEGMLKVLEPLHEMLEEGAAKNDTTIKERAFIEVLA